MKIEQKDENITLYTAIVSSVRVWLARLTQRMPMIVFGAIPSLQIYSS